jgi:hypothetical protein
MKSLIISFFLLSFVTADAMAALQIAGTETAITVFDKDKDKKKKKNRACCKKDAAACCKKPSAENGASTENEASTEKSCKKVSCCKKGSTQTEQSGSEAEKQAK